MEITEMKTDQGIVFGVKGRIDMETAPELDKRLNAVIEAGPQIIIMDCSQLEYITSAGLHVLHKFGRRLRQARRTLVICALADYLREIFQIVELNRQLPIINSPQEAWADPALQIST